MASGSAAGGVDARPPLPEDGSAARPGLLQAARVWLRIGLLGVGGPAAQIALLHREVVERHRWIDAQRFLHALNFCMLLPGPEAQQLATWIGWRLHGVAGGLLAGTLFVLPGLVAIVALGAVHIAHGDLHAVASIFLGLQAAVIAVVLRALVGMARRVLLTRAQLAIAVIAFVLIHAFALPFPALVVLAAIAGWLWSSRVPAPASLPLATAAMSPATARAGAADNQGGDVVDPPAGAASTPTWRRTLRTVLACLVVWWAPILMLALWLGADSVLVELGVFFGQVAVVSFGGAYAVLAYVAQYVVEARQWLDAADMIDGLALAEATPGPLVLVNAFVGQLVAERHAAGGLPWLMGLAGAGIVAWTTFAPSFLWIFAGGPWLDVLRRQRGLAAALAGVTAAVVGVMASLALWFALRVLFAETTPLSLGIATLQWPRWQSLDPGALALALLAGLLLARRWGLLPVLAIAAAGGWLLGLAATR